jgi:hypothetical protein
MSTLKVNAIQTTAGVEVYTCKAWVNFNGGGTVAIRASGNVSSITDNGAGYFTVNFTTSMPDTNYALIGYARADSANTGSFAYVSAVSTDAKAVGSMQIRQGVQASGTTFPGSDSPEVNIAVFR